MRKKSPKARREKPQPFENTIHWIDTFTDWIGRTVAWLIVPLTLGLTWEVISRYGFDAPTIWAYDMSYMLYAALFMLGCAYALHKGGHIRTDIFWEKWSVRRKSTVDLIAYVVFFFPAIIMLLASSVDEAYYAWSIAEQSEQTAWRPALWPLKSLVPLTMFLLLVQGISELLKVLHAVRTGKLFEKKEGFEV
jgi:TRAP-type mannitol/chloroaromatic compound transport system permease small subunit